jgi:hypothetical protein
VTGQAAPFSVIKLEQFPWYLNKLSSGIVIKLRDMVADLPEEAVAERQAASEHGIKSSLSVPIAVSQTVFSAISVFTTHTYRDWSAVKPDSDWLVRFSRRRCFSNRTEQSCGPAKLGFEAQVIKDITTSD